MEWQDIVLIILVIWAAIHTYMDFKQSQKIDKLEKK